MIDGLTLTLVGMLFVFAFLIVLVVAMVLLRLAAGRIVGHSGPSEEIVAAVAAALLVRDRERLAGGFAAEAREGEK